MSFTRQQYAKVVPTLPTGDPIANYSTYAEAQAAVKYLADQHFPVESLTIVGTNLTSVERVTGRLSYGRVAIAGAMSGAWFGLFVGVMMSLFGTSTGLVSGVGLISVLIGAGFGLLFSVISYGMTRSRRDFTSSSQIVAGSYSVLCMPAAAGEARRLLIASPVGIGRGGIGVPVAGRPVVSVAPSHPTMAPPPVPPAPPTPASELTTYHGPMGAPFVTPLPDGAAAPESGVPVASAPKLDSRWVTPDGKPKFGALAADHPGVELPNAQQADAAAGIPAPGEVTAVAPFMPPVVSKDSAAPSGDGAAKKTPTKTTPSPRPSARHLLHFRIHQSNRFLQFCDNIITVVQKAGIRTPDNNPFRPGFGAVPEVWAGSETVLARFDRERRDRLAGRYTRGAVLIGPSGVGKSVLVNKFASEAAERGDVVLEAIRVAKRSDPIAHLAGAIAKAQQSLATDNMIDAIERLLSKLNIISVKGVQIAVTKEGVSNPHLVIRDSLVAIGRHLAIENASRKPDNQRALVIRIDELQNADEGQRSAILAALGDVLEYQFELPTKHGTNAGVLTYLPILVFLTGLPELINKATDVDTFRRRFHTTPLGMLADGEVIDSLIYTPLPDGVTFTPGAARYLAEIVCGDPYLFQLAGHHAWDASGQPEISVENVQIADRETYSERLRIVESAATDIPDGEWEILDAIYSLAKVGQPVASKDVAESLGKTPAQIATSAQRLERRAAITREWDGWHIENRLLHRYRTTGDILSV